MTTFYLCPHGETENNKNGLLSGWVDTPLTNKGIEDAASTAKKLQGITFDTIIASDLGRAVTTAHIIAKKNDYTGTVEQFSEFREVNYGNLANQHITAHAKVPMREKSSYAPPGGESLGQMQARVIQGLKRVNNAHKSEQILLVAHDGTINAIYALFTNRDIADVDTESSNAHDFVAKFTYQVEEIISFSIME